MNSLFESNKNIPHEKFLKLVISATTLNQKSSSHIILVDMTQVLGTYYASFAFDKNVILDFEAKF